MKPGKYVAQVVGIDFNAAERRIVEAMAVRTPHGITIIKGLINVSYDMSRDNFRWPFPAPIPRNERNRHHKRPQQPNCGPQRGRW